MTPLRLCTILLAVLSCSARPNMTPGFLVGNAERSPTSHRIDLPKLLQDIQEVVSKAAKDASENAKQHVAAMKQKNVEMIRQHFLQSLAPIPYIKDRLDTLNPHWNLRPKIIPCVGCLHIKSIIGSTYQPSYTSQTNLSPCRGNIVTCLQTLGLPSHRPADTSAANRPCLDLLCKQTHKTPLSSTPVYPKNLVSKPTVNNNEGTVSLNKNSSNHFVEFSKPSHHISSTRVPVLNESSTKPPLFPFTLPEKLFNLAMDSTTPKMVDSIETLYDLRKNSSILENEILEIEPVEFNEEVSKISSKPTSKDNPVQHNTTVPDFATLARNELETTTSMNACEQITSLKSLDTLTNPEEELKTESTNIKEDQERTDALTLSPSNKHLALGENEVTPPTKFSVISIKKGTNQDLTTTDKTNEWDSTENIYQLKTTGEPLFVTETLFGNEQETILEHSEPKTNEDSASSAVHGHVLITNKEPSKKAFQEQQTTKQLNLNKLTTTNETNGPHENIANELDFKIRDDLVYSKQIETTTASEYNTSTLKTKVLSNKNVGVTDEFPDTTTIDSSLLSEKVIFNGLKKIAQSDEVTREHEEIETTERTNVYSGIEFKLSTEIPDSVTTINGKSDETPVDDMEENTISSDYFKDLTESTVVSAELTTQAANNHISLNYDSKTENRDDLFETTTLNVLNNKEAWDEENNNFYNTNNGADFSEVTAREYITSKSETSTQEEEVTGYIEVNTINLNTSNTNVENQTQHFGTLKEQYSENETSELSEAISSATSVYENNTTNLNSSKINVENQTQPFGIMVKERFSDNNIFGPTTIATKPELLTNAPITEYNELIIESRGEVNYDFEGSFETTTNFEQIGESTTNPIKKDLGEVDITNDILDYSTVSDNGEEITTTLDDFRSSGLSGEPTSYQDGVLKFTTELDSETDASPTDNSKAPSPFSAIMQNSLRTVRDKPTLRGMLPLSPVQSLKHCVGLLDCLISKPRSKRFSLDNNIKSFSSGKPISSLNNKNSSHLTFTPRLSKEKRSNAERFGLNGPALLELLPVVREGYRNNAFNEDDKEIIRTIFGDLGSRMVEENVDSLKEGKDDLLMKDATARIEETIEDEDYVSLEYEDLYPKETEPRLKRSKRPYKRTTTTLKKTPNDQGKNANTKSASQRARREIRSSQQFVEAAAILALLAEQSDVQLDAPDDEEEDYYEYYDDEGSDNVALGDDFGRVDQEAYEDEDYGEPSFVELIKLARRHNQRKSRQES